MRSLGEIAFRARQELANLLLLAWPPRFRGTAPRRLNLPNASAAVAALRGSEFAGFIEETANEILAHRFLIFERVIETGPKIRWRRDYMHGLESGSVYFRRISYLDFAAVGDHKFIWELNRHQHLVLLAQAFLFTGRAEFKQEIFGELGSWFEQNPFQRGINWASALEVAFRALSWIWVYHFVGNEMPENFRNRFLTELYRHGRHLADNLSIYFSPNTHLLGEAVALHALGTLFPAFAQAAQWQRRGAEVVEAQFEFQVKPDGSHFEQSTYYHVYALDFFVQFYLLAGRPAKFREVLLHMAEYLFYLLGPARRIACFGDDDGGRLFHPYGERRQFGRATLATCGILLGREDWIGNTDDLAKQAAWWMGADCLKSAGTGAHIPTGNRFFADSGAAFLKAGDLWVQMDFGPFGVGGAGHSHSDTLSLVLLMCGEEDVFVDPGTYTYISDPLQRNWFRGSAAHNTVRVDGLDQGDPAGPFRWASKPEVILNAWHPETEGGFIDGTCRYRGFSHRRRALLESGRLLVLDEIEGPAGEHICEQIWQLGPAASKVRIAFSGPVTERESKFSPVYGTEILSRSLVSISQGQLPIQIAMLLTCDAPSEITVAEASQILERKGLAAAHR